MNERAGEKNSKALFFFSYWLWHEGGLLAQEPCLWVVSWLLDGKEEKHVIFGIQQICDSWWGAPVWHDYKTAHRGRPGVHWACEMYLRTYSACNMARGCLLSPDDRLPFTTWHQACKWGKLRWFLNVGKCQKSVVHYPHDRSVGCFRAVTCSNFTIHFCSFFWS